MKKVFSFVCVYVCTIIGASFITGNEIYTFFARYGAGGYILCMLCVVLFITLCLAIMLKCKRANVVNLIEACAINKSGGIIARVMQVFTYCTYFMFSALMLAGLREIFGIYFTLACTLVCYFLIRKDMRSIIKVNVILLPFVLVYLFILFVLCFWQTSGTIQHSISVHSVFNIFTYVSLNVILLFGSMLKITVDMTKRQIVWSVILSSLVFAFFIVVQIFILTNIRITNFDMPLIELAGKNKWVLYYTLVVTCLAMISSFLSSTHSLYDKIKVSKQCDFYLIILLWCMLITSNLGFSSIVQLSYIVLGVISLLLVVYLCLKKI